MVSAIFSASTGELILSGVWLKILLTSEWREVFETFRTLSGRFGHLEKVSDALSGKVLVEIESLYTTKYFSARNSSQAVA